MNVRNCRKCGKIFNYVAGPVICPKCKAASEEDFQKVKKYIQDNKGVGIPEVSTECEVEPSQVRQWIREERLEFAEGSSVGIECEKCGAIIRTGRFCDRCKTEMITEMNGAIHKPKAKPISRQEPTDNARMRFF